MTVPSIAPGVRGRLRLLSVGQRVLVAVLSGIGLAGIFGLLGITFAAQSLESADTALRTLLPATATTNQLLADVVDQETGERGYVITAEPNFLQPYYSGRAAVPGLEKELLNELAGHSRPIADLSQVESRYGAWANGYAVRQIADVRDGDVSAAVATEKTGKGKELFDALRRSVSSLSAEIDVEQNAALSHVRGLQEATLWLVVAMTVCLMAGSLLASFLLRRWVIRPIRTLQREVALVSAGDIDHPVPVVGPPEIASLSSGVESMRQRVRAGSREIDVLRSATETLQRSLLPVLLPSPPELEVSARYLAGVSGTKVGGDWFNVWDLGEGRGFFAVGDVSGRGLDAAVRMAELRHAVRAYLVEDPAPGTVLDRLSALTGWGKDGQFATVLTALVDTRAGTVSLASAGHPPPVLAAGGTAELLALSAGPPIGLRHRGYLVTESEFPVRATLVACSDGLVERRGETITDGLERLRAAASVELPTEELIDHLLATLVPEGADDDIVVLGVRRRA